MKLVKGTGVFGGVAIGNIYVFEKREYDFNPNKINNVDAECDRFLEAKNKATAQIKALYEKALNDLGAEHADIFDAHLIMLNDISDEITDKIKSESINAEYAVFSVGEDTAQMFASMDDDYMKARAVDIKDISMRVVDCLLGYESKEIVSDEKVVIFAEDLAPSETVNLDKNKICAFVTQKGSANSHTAILARMMNIPSIVMADFDFKDDFSNKLAVVDGFNGTVTVEPDDNYLSEMTKKRDELLDKKAKLNELKGKENITIDGKTIKVYANIGGPKDLESVLENDAGGVGLFRSEFLYLSKSDYPTEEEQFEAYKTVAEGLNGKNVVIRTLDIGADKQIDYFNMEHEENPALGYRAIRICLDRIAIFKTQLRALYRASAYGNISIMFPMIISVDEVLKIKEICKEVMKELDAENIKYNPDVELGIMIETPAAVMISDLLAKEVDFFSVGTNDLTQYTLAIDRQNQKLENIYDPHHPAILRMLKMITENAHKEGIWVGICGELGADMELTKYFLEIGIDELSVAPPFVLPLRDIIRNTDLSK